MSQSDPPSNENTTSAYRDRPENRTTMPGGIPYIIGNEAAERFSFYGMKAILTVFMVDYLHRMGSTYVDAGMSRAEATEHYHTFTAAAYFFPVLGALLSDAVFGKYRTILWLSIVYCIGHAALAFMGTPPISAGMWLFLGLLLISVGSGGIKPCVSAHVGDQFGKSNAHLLTKVYQWFYFSINLGSFVSTLLTPYLLEHYGPHWAFGVPGVLMGIATLLFWMGRNKFVHIRPGGQRFLAEVFSPVGLGAIAKLAVIFAFVVPFWALFDQTGSSWVLQAKDLNRNWLGVEWLESQIQAINPILVLTLIPVFQFFVYPAIDRVFPLTPIRKISLGLFVMVGGFAIVSVIQERVDAGAQPSISWQFLAYAILTASEVMVSITCLEFAYTQAPKTMKSIVMALFLFSVSLGNFFTAFVNNYIQTPALASLSESLDPDIDLIETSNWTAKPTSSDSESNDAGDSFFSVAGADGQFDTADDYNLILDTDNQVKEITSASSGAFNEAAETIETKFLAMPDADKASLPDEETANEWIKGSVDAFGNAIEYRLRSRDQFELVSFGADKTENTRFDETLLSSLERATAANAGADESEPYFNWLERRIIELRSNGDESISESVQQEIIQKRGQGSETKFARNFQVGGRVLLDGATYFWFWTMCILITAVIFVPAAMLYREKTYIQDSEDSESHAAEAAADESMTTA